MSLIGVALFVALGALVGTIGSILGAGGGFLLVPILALLEPSLPSATLTGMSFGMIVFNATSASATYLRQRRVDLASAVPFALGAVPGSLAGAAATRGVPRGAFDAAFGVLLIGLAVFLAVRRPPAPPAAPAAAAGRVRRELRDATGKVHVYDVNVPLGVAFSFGIGFLASIFGIGGGVILVPIMVVVLGFPPHIAAATSMVVLLVTAIAGSAVHVAAGDLADHGLETIALGVGALAGGNLGARIAPRVGGAVIVRLLAAALVLVGLRLVARVAL